MWVFRRWGSECHTYFVTPKPPHSPLHITVSSEQCGGGASDNPSEPPQQHLSVCASANPPVTLPDGHRLRMNINDLHILFPALASIPQALLPSPQGKRGNESVNQLLGTVHTLKLYKTRKEIQSVDFYTQSINSKSLCKEADTAEYLPSAKFLDKLNSCPCSAGICSIFRGNKCMNLSNFSSGSEGINATKEIQI